MPEPLASLDRAPVSVHTPFISYHGGQYRHEDPEEHRAALPVALDGVQLGAYDQRILHRLTGWDVPIVAAVVSLLRRTRHAARQDGRGGGESR
jgi:hypothetical protein